MHRTFLLLSCAVLLAAPATGRAEVYRCQKNGQIVYSDQPCAPNAKPAKLPRTTVVPSSGKSHDLAHEYDRRLAKGQKARNREDAKWIKAHRAKEARDRRIRAALIKQRVVVGMTPEQVRRVLGDPLKISRSKSKSGTGETWTYNDASGRRVIHFRDGRVARIRTTRHKR